MEDCIKPLRPYNGKYRPSAGKFAIVGRGVFDGEWFLIVDYKSSPFFPVEEFDCYNKAVEEIRNLQHAQRKLTQLNPIIDNEFYILNENGQISNIREPVD